MNTERIKEIQKETAYPNSVSVQQALLKVWNECEQDGGQPAASEEEISKVIRYELMFVPYDACDRTAKAIKELLNR